MEDFSDWKCGHYVSSTHQRCIDSELLEFDETSVRFSSYQFEDVRLILDVNVELNNKTSLKSSNNALEIWSARELNDLECPIRNVISN